MIRVTHFYVSRVLLLSFLLFEEGRNVDIIHADCDIDIIHPGEVYKSSSHIDFVMETVCNTQSKSLAGWKVSSRQSNP